MSAGGIRKESLPCRDPCPPQLTRGEAGSRREFVVARVSKVPCSPWRRIFHQAQRRMRDPPAAAHDSKQSYRPSLFTLSSNQWGIECHSRTASHTHDILSQENLNARSKFQPPAFQYRVQVTLQARHKTRKLAQTYSSSPNRTGHHNLRYYITQHRAQHKLNSIEMISWRDF